jgi:DNA-binding CsgD family transcriptional regulator
MEAARTTQITAPAPAQYAGDDVLLEGLIEPLTRREHEILRLLAQGYTAPEIARHLTLALSTVKSYVQHVYEKLFAHSRREAVARGRALGLLEAPAQLPAGPSAWPAAAGSAVIPWPEASLAGAEAGRARSGLESLAAMVPAGYVLVLVMPQALVRVER